MRAIAGMPNSSPPLAGSSALAAPIEARMTWLSIPNKLESPWSCASDLSHHALSGSGKLRLRKSISGLTSKRTAGLSKRALPLDLS